MKFRFFFHLVIFGGLLFGLTVSLPAVAVTVNEQQEDAVSQYQLIKSRYLNARGEMLRARSAFIEARGKWQTEKQDGTAMLTTAKEYLEKADQAAIHYLEMVKAYTQTNNHLDESDRSSIAAELAQKIAWFEQRKKEIELVDNRTALTAQGIALREYWSDVRPSIKRITGELLVSDVQAVHKIFQQNEKLVSERVSKAKAEGKSTETLDTLLSTYQSQLTAAEEKFGRARVRFTSIRSLQDADAVYQEAHGLLKEASFALEAGNRSLNSILQEFQTVEISSVEAKP